MVCHETECMRPVLIAFEHFLEQKREAAAVQIVKEYILACIAAQDDVKYCPRIMDARFSCHERHYTVLFPYCKPDPDLVKHD